MKNYLKYIYDRKLMLIGILILIFGNIVCYYFNNRLLDIKTITVLIFVIIVGWKSK